MSGFFATRMNGGTISFLIHKFVVQLKCITLPRTIRVRLHAKFEPQRDEVGDIPIFLMHSPEGTVSSALCSAISFVPTFVPAITSCSRIFARLFVRK